ncbi:syntaxin [Auriculariales sp. MPI-PUGE-AT-0066]|nr:syntaxin [Auriculariales sp. MPI-PUGE-AT-0066]
MTTPLAVTVPSHRQVTEPKTHIEFKIVASASVQTWDVWKRYSEFEQLHDDLEQNVGSAPPCELPPKHTFSLFRSMNDPHMLEERRQGLERYLRTILATHDSKWRDDIAFRDFLSLQPTKAGPAGGTTGSGKAAPQFTAASWLDEQLDLQAAARDVRAETNKRDALAERGDVNGSHQANSQAKKKLAALTSRVGALTSGLADLAGAGMSEGEVQRRTDMVSRLSDDCQKLSRIVIAAKSARVAVQPISSAQAHAERNELLGDASNGNGRTFGSRPATRIFGGGNKPVVAEETETTRPLDQHGLLNLQQLQIEDQDVQLNQLSAILERQKHLGMAISNEIDEQNEMLDQFTDEVDRTTDKLKGAKSQMARLR